MLDEKRRAKLGKDDDFVSVKEKEPGLLKMMKRPYDLLMFWKPFGCLKSCFPKLARVPLKVFKDILTHNLDTWSDLVYLCTVPMYNRAFFWLLLISFTAPIGLSLIVACNAPVEVNKFFFYSWGLIIF